jgi:hypothetical protein
MGVDSHEQLPAIPTCVHTPHVPMNFAVLLWRKINLPAVIAAVCAQALPPFLVSGLPSSLELQILHRYLHAWLFHVELGCIRVDFVALLLAQSGTQLPINYHPCYSNLCPHTSRSNVLCSSSPARDQPSCGDWCSVRPSAYCFPCKWTSIIA